MYKIISDTMIRRLSDGACIPADEGNTDYCAFLSWKAEGNEAEPEEQEVPKASPKELLEELERSSMMNRGMREFLILSMQDLAERKAGGDQTKAAAILAAIPAWTKAQQLNNEAIRLRSLL